MIFSSVFFATNELFEYSSSIFGSLRSACTICVIVSVLLNDTAHFGRVIDNFFANDFPG